MAHTILAFLLASATAATLGCRLCRNLLSQRLRGSPDENVEPYRRRVHKPEGDVVHKRLAGWEEFIAADIGSAWPEMPPGIKDRDADVWEPLLAVADAAGGNWPDRARVSCVSLVSASKVATPSLGIRLLADMKTVFGSNDRISTKSIIESLCSLPEAPWSDLRGKTLSDTGLADRLKPYGVKSKQIRIGDWTGKGYERADLYDAWKRYLSTPPHERETGETSETAEAAE